MRQNRCGCNILANISYHAHGMQLMRPIEALLAAERESEIYHRSNPTKEGCFRFVSSPWSIRSRGVSRDLLIQDQYKQGRSRDGFDPPGSVISQQPRHVRDPREHHCDQHPAVHVRALEYACLCHFLSGSGHVRRRQPSCTASESNFPSHLGGMNYARGSKQSMHPVLGLLRARRMLRAWPVAMASRSDAQPKWYETLKPVVDFDKKARRRKHRFVTRHTRNTRVRTMVGSSCYYDTGEEVGAVASC